MMNTPFMRVGLPLLGFMVMGTLGLTQFVGGTKETGDAIRQNRSQREFDVEAEHEAMMKKLAPQMENYENKPIVRQE